MLEIILIISLCKKIGEMVERKGHRSGWYKFFVVAGWLGGEFGGAFCAGVVCAILGDGEGNFAIIYGSALACAALGVGAVFWFASMLPDERLQSLPAASSDLPAPPAMADDGANPYRAPGL